MVYAWFAPLRLPFAWSTFAVPSAVRTSSSDRPYPSSAVGFAWIRTAGFWPPAIETSPTPESCEIFCARIVSAVSSTFESGSESLVSESVMIGASAGFTLL
jgi:hypothetical protein